MVTEYKILRGPLYPEKDFVEIEKRVNEAIKEGWTPLGGVCATNLDKRWFAQAMIKEREK